MASKVEEARTGVIDAVFEYHPEAPNEDTVNVALDALIAAVREEERERLSALFQFAREWPRDA